MSKRFFGLRARCFAVSAILAAVFCVVSTPARASASFSIGIWPAERHSEGILYLFGEDWNSMLIELRAGGLGVNPVELPSPLEQETVLELVLPGDVRFLGADVHDGRGVRDDFKVDEFTRDGRRYQRAIVTLCNETVNHRTIRNSWGSYFFIWFESPAELDDIAEYRLLYGGKELVSSGVSPQ